MRVTEQEALAAMREAVAKVRKDVVESWASEKLPLVREQLWNQYQAIERIEECIGEEFSNILRRGAGG